MTRHLPPYIHIALRSAATLYGSVASLSRHTELCKSITSTARLFNPSHVRTFRALSSIMQHVDKLCSSDIARRQHLRSAGCHQLFVPRHRRSMFGRRAFFVAGPAAWNLLPDHLRDPSRSFDSFRRDLKTFFLVLLAYAAP